MLAADPLQAGLTFDIQAQADEAFARRLSPRSTAPLVVALSGGSDSLALLRLACAWAVRAGRRVLAVTVDHQLQPQSAAWTRAAGEAAARAGADFRSLAWTGPKPASGLPAAARAARHRLVAEAAREAGASVILFGHTRDDAAENALMRQAGSTLGSLAEWSPSPVWPQGRGLFHFRPLLALRRADLRAMLRAAGEDWIEDPANADLRYARPRARAALAAGAAPDIASSGRGDIARLALQITVEPWGFSFERASLTGPDAARVLSAALVCASGDEHLPRSERVRALLDRLAGGNAFTATLAGARIEAGERVAIMREAGERGRRRAAATLTPLALGEPVVWDGRFEITAYRPGLAVQKLAGLAGRLGPAERAGLKAMPPAARLALPAVTDAAGAVTCPVLAQDGPSACRPLWGQRLLAACDVRARED